MPAGGTWVIQDKQRPGTYVNVKSANRTTTPFGNRGTVAVALPMTWGPQDQLIELSGTDLQDGKSLAKVGCTIFDIVESLPYRVALSGCQKALIFRADKDGVKATATIDTEVVVNAKYTGTTGNAITVAVTNDKPAAGSSTIQILVRGSIKETGIINTATPSELVRFDSKFVDFVVGETAAALVAGNFNLVEGANGVVSDASYQTFFNLLTVKQWQCLAIQSNSDTVASLIETKIRFMRATLGRKVQGVVYNDVTSNYEGILAVKQGFKTSVDTVGTDLFPVWVASQTAGAEVDESKTAFVIPGATEIINHIKDDSIVADLKQGWFILTYRQDGAVCVEQDINSYHSLTDDRSYVFSKNRVVRCLDEISNLVSLRFNSNYAGKMDNNGMGRNLFKSEIISDMDVLSGIGAIQDFRSADVEVLPGEGIEDVVADLFIKPVDSMEKLYVTVNLTN